MVVTAFEWALIVFLFAGLIVPAWLSVSLLKAAIKRPRQEVPGARYFAYVRLLDSIHSGIATGTVDNGAIWAASIRELRNFPEYRDLSLLYLEEITITGSSKFDAIMKSELEVTEGLLLGAGGE